MGSQSLFYSLGGYFNDITFPYVVDINVNKVLFDSVCLVPQVVLVIVTNRRAHSIPYSKTILLIIANIH